MKLPENPDALQSLASQLRQAGRVPEAIEAYERLLAMRPHLPDGWFNLAWLQRRAGRFEAALTSYQQALDRAVTGPEEVHLNRAAILSNLARPAEAERELVRALTLNPRYVPAWLNLGNLHEDHGRREGAAQAYERVLQLEPANALALARLANVHRVAHAADPLITRLQQAIARPGQSAQAQADLGFGLGKLLDEAGAYDEAFAAYQAANQASRRAARPGVNYDAAAHEQTVDALIAAPAAAAPPTPGDRSPPIFICGMFRSGSTLVEQILAAHPRVTAGGEMDLLPTLMRQPPAPTGLAPLRRAYLDGLASLHPTADLVTDKRPDNFLHIGAIKAMFPDAKIVHTRRHPLDNCLSIFFLHLGHAMPYALDLQDTAHWYRQYRRLMAHWKTLYGDDILDVDYDALVADPKPVVERLLAHLGLDWDDACLAFHEQANVVRTASVWQVRQPLYTRSSGRWRHYEKHLAGLRAGLAELGGLT